MSSEITEVEILQLRQVMMQILGLPRERVAALFIVIEELPDGTDRQRMSFMGLTKEGMAVMLRRALQTVLNDEPSRSGEMSDRKD